MVLGAVKERGAVNVCEPAGAFHGPPSGAHVHRSCGSFPESFAIRTEQQVSSGQERLSYLRLDIRLTSRWRTAGIAVGKTAVP